MNTLKIRGLWLALQLDRSWCSERRRITPVPAFTLAGMVGGALQGIVSYRMALGTGLQGDSFVWDALERFAWIGAATGLSVGTVFSLSRSLIVRLSLSPLIAIVMVTAVNHLYCGERPVYLWSSWPSEEEAAPGESLRWGLWLGGTGGLSLALTGHLLRRLGGKVRLQTIALLGAALITMRLQSFVPTGWIEAFHFQPNYGCGTASANMYRDVPLGIGELLIVLSTAVLLLYGHLLARLMVKLQCTKLIPVGVAGLLILGISGIAWGSETMLWTPESPIETVGFGFDRGEAVTLHEGGILRFWEIARVSCTGSPRVSRTDLVRLHHGPIRSSTFALSRWISATGSEDGWIELWDLSTRTRLTEFHASTERIRTLALSEDGSVLAATGPGSQIFLWKLVSPDNSDEFHLLSLPNLQLPSGGEPYGLGLSPEGRRLAVSSFRSGITVHETSTGKLLFHRDGSRRYFPEAPILSKRGRFLASRSGGGFLKIDDLDRKTTKTCSSGINPLAFSPDGRMLLASGRDSIQFLDVETAKVLMTLECEDGGRRGTFSPDGRSCIVASENSFNVFDHLPVVGSSTR